MRYYSKLSISLAPKCHMQNRVGAGNRLGDLAASVASCFTDCHLPYFVRWECASQLIRWMDGPDFGAGESGKGQGRSLDNGQGCDLPDPASQHRSSCGKRLDQILSWTWPAGSLVFSWEGFSEILNTEPMSNYEGSPADLECDSHMGNLRLRSTFRKDNFAISGFTEIVLCGLCSVLCLYFCLQEVWKEKGPGQPQRLGSCWLEDLNADVETVGGLGSATSLVVGDVSLVGVGLYRSEGRSSVSVFSN